MQEPLLEPQSLSLLLADTDTFVSNSEKFKQFSEKKNSGAQPKEKPAAAPQAFSYSPHNVQFPSSINRVNGIADSNPSNAPQSNSWASQTPVSIDDTLMHISSFLHPTEDVFGRRAPAGVSRKLDMSLLTANVADQSSSARQQAGSTPENVHLLNQYDIEDSNEVFEKVTSFLNFKVFETRVVQTGINPMKVLPHVHFSFNLTDAIKQRFGGEERLSQNVLKHFFQATARFVNSFNQDAFVELIDYETWKMSLGDIPRLELAMRAALEKNQRKKYSKLRLMKFQLEKALSSNRRKQEIDALTQKIHVSLSLLMQQQQITELPSGG